VSKIYSGTPASNRALVVNIFSITVIKYLLSPISTSARLLQLFLLQALLYLLQTHAMSIKSMDSKKKVKVLLFVILYFISSLKKVAIYVY
jgi:hypothetical protein